MAQQEEPTVMISPWWSILHPLQKQEPHIAPHLASYGAGNLVLLQGIAAVYWYFATCFIAFLRSNAVILPPCGNHSLQHLAQKFDALDMGQHSHPTQEKVPAKTTMLAALVLDCKYSGLSWVYWKRRWQTSNKALILTAYAPLANTTQNAYN